MKVTITSRNVLMLLGLIALLHMPAGAQNVTYKPGAYPAPRYPKIPRNVKVDDLMPLARTIVKRSDNGSMFFPGYAVKTGERVLMMASREIDPLIVEALTKAIREAGGKVDVLLGDAVRRNVKDGTYHGDGETEFEYFTYMKEVLSVQTGGLGWPEQAAMAQAGKYNLVIAGDGGGTPDYPPDKMRWAYLPWKSLDQFLVSAGGIPPELLKVVDDTAWGMLKDSVGIHATDPEGTDMTWSGTPEDWERPGAHMPGHLMSHPNAGHGAGTIGGTFNHTGP